MLTQPELITTTSAVSESDNERDFSLLLSTVSVTYTAHDCTNGLTLLSGYYGNREDGKPIQIEQVANYNYKKIFFIKDVHASHCDFVDD